MTSNGSHRATPGSNGLTVREDVPAPPTDSALTRRTALKMMSATALLTTVGCTRKPERRIISMVERAEYQLPGKALHYASTWTDGPYPYGLMMRVVDGRPIKVEGLPDHPLNKGRSTVAMQASLLSLYDPERLRTPQRDGEDTDWKQADEAIVKALRESRSSMIVTRPTLGPSERRLLRTFLASVPGSRHFVHASGGDRVRRAAWKRIYGRDGLVEPRLAGAKVIVSVDADFLGTDGDVLGASRDYAESRDLDRGPSGMSRLYVAESGMTTTGASADHRIPLRPAAMLDLVEALSGVVEGGPTSALEAVAKKHGLDGKVVAALASDLRANNGKAVVLAGQHLPAAVHASVALLNHALGAPGSTLAWNPEPASLPADDPADIAAALAAGPDVAIFLGVNPAYDAGVGEEALAKIKLTVGHGLSANETVSACAFALPSAHNMESWNDAAPGAGQMSICQPLIAPLFGGRQEAESLLVWTKALRPSDPAVAKVADFHAFLRSEWMSRHLGAGSKRAWEDALRKGFVGTPQRASFPMLRDAEAGAMVAEGMGMGLGGAHDVVTAPDAYVADGRYAGNVWLLELPDPSTKLMWDNGAVMSPATAKELAVGEGDWVSIRAGEVRVELPVLVQRGVARGAVMTNLGWGRTKGAGVGNGVGVNASPLLAAGASPGTILGATVAKADRAWYELVRSQQSFDEMDGDLDRQHVRHGTPKEYEADKGFAKHRIHVPPLKQIDDEWDYSKGHKWGMAIDLNRCTGCQACVIACQSENNVAPVGKEECSKGRDMAWIRLDRYESHDDENPHVGQQPMLCQHCDNAPCETVCPVNATAHSPEGLNEQVYNRCVGTRYCLNNCPYKVRRFNFYSYGEQDLVHEVQELAANPNVTVRSRGVMEKCTFCIQRINAVKFKAANAGIALEDGAAIPACQQSCPSNAIVFGDVNLPGSAVQKARESDLAYHVLQELNVRPNVTYLARVRNLHPSLDAVPDKKAH